jgi:guanylate cyclase
MAIRFNRSAGLMKRLLNRITQAVSQPEDDQETRLRKATLVTASMMFVPAGIIWGIIYIGFGAHLSGFIPLGYGLVSIASLVYFARTRSYIHYRASQLLLILILPGLLMASLGGFVPSSAVIIWSFICPIGALMFAGRRQARPWFIIYLVLLSASGFVDRGTQAPVALPNSLVVFFFVMNIGAVSAIVFTMMSYFNSEKDHIHALLKEEQKTTERLLLNILPREIVPALKAGNSTTQRFESASILFADLVNFTSLSNQLTPEETVDLLNEIFSYFDTLVDRYKVEKIRTIGDNYMTVSGVPTPRPDHAQALGSMALDMCRYLELKPWRQKVDLNFRLGMSSGPLVGAVIGRSKFHYDVWGDAVNMASRMESQGIPGKIQLTPRAHELLKDDFICKRRGVIAVKGAGRMETWFLVGRRE